MYLFRERSSACITTEFLQHFLILVTAIRIIVSQFIGFCNRASFSTTNEDILKDWAEIRKTANEILSDSSGSPVRQRVPLAGNNEAGLGKLQKG